MLNMATLDDIIQELEKREITYLFICGEDHGEDSDGFHTAFKVSGRGVLELVGALEMAKHEVMCGPPSNAEEYGEDDEESEDIPS